MFGGRDFTQWQALYAFLDALDAEICIECIIEGEARGADTLARLWAEARGIPVDPFPADWQAHGRRAGPIRNQKMLTEGRIDLAVQCPGGAGTADMRRRLDAAGIPVRPLF